MGQRVHCLKCSLKWNLIVRTKTGKAGTKQRRQIELVAANSQYNEWTEKKLYKYDTKSFLLLSRNLISTFLY